MPKPLLGDTSYKIVAFNPTGAGKTPKSGKRGQDRTVGPETAMVSSHRRENEGKKKLVPLLVAVVRLTHISGN